MVPDTDVNDSYQRDVHLAGYRECVKKAVIYLLKDQQATASNEQVQSMSSHLTMRQAHFEYQRMLEIAEDHHYTVELKQKLIAMAYKGCDFHYS